MEENYGETVKIQFYTILVYGNEGAISLYVRSIKLSEEKCLSDVKV